MSDENHKAAVAFFETVLWLERQAEKDQAKQAKIIAGIKRVIDAQAAAERRKHDAAVMASNARENAFFAAHYFGPRKVYTYAQCPECGADGRPAREHEFGPQYDCVEPGCK